MICVRPAWPPFETPGCQKLTEPAMRLGNMKASNSGVIWFFTRCALSAKGSKQRREAWSCYLTAQKSTIRRKVSSHPLFKKVNWHWEKLCPATPHTGWPCGDSQSPLRGSAGDEKHPTHHAFILHNEKKVTVINTLNHSQNKKKSERKKFNLLEMFYAVFSL